MIKQNTPEWLEMRKSKIGASDAAIIMGISPWKTPFQLWEEKVGIREEPTMNDAMRRGHELEPIARQAYIDLTGNYIEPAVVIHPEKSWMMASLDGLSEDKKIVVEIKCPGHKDHQIAADGQIPEKYYPQLQHQLAIIGLDELHYFSYKDGNFHLVKVARDEKFIQELYVKELEFWQKVRNFEAPALSEKDYVMRNDEKWAHTAKKWAHAKSEAETWKKREELCKKELLEMSGDSNTLGEGVRVQKIISKGRINYSAIPELKLINTEKHRGASTQSWRVSAYRKS